MLIHTRPRCSLSDEGRAVNALKLDPVPESLLWYVRVTGDDPAAVCRAAGLAKAAVSVSKRGRYWFRATLDDLAKLRAEMVLGDASLAGWLWWARPRADYFLPGMSGVDFTSEPDGGQPANGTVTVEARGPADTGSGSGHVPATEPPGPDVVPDGTDGTAGGHERA